MIRVEIVRDAMKMLAGNLLTIEADNKVIWIGRMRRHG